MSHGSPTQSSSHPRHHVTARYGPTAHVVYHDHGIEPERAEGITDLIRPWTIRQWIDGGKLHREPTSREVPRFELFFDLLFVAVIHALAEAAIEEPGWPAVVRFILTFWPSWSIWEEQRKYANVSGTDDLLHRCWILIGMMTILGYAANASAISLHVDPSSAEKEYRAVQAAAAFWLGIKATRVFVLFLYAQRLPSFRHSQLFQAVAVLLPMLVYLPLLWVQDRHTQIILASVGLVTDIFRVDMLIWNGLGRWQGKKRERGHDGGWFGMPKLDEGWRIPAINIEHALERYSAFVVIVLGEMVMNLLYSATYSELGLSPKFGKAALGLMIAWALNYLYLLPSEPNADYEHGLRRSMFTGLCFTFFHWPLVASLILASAAIGHMVNYETVSAGMKWYWSGGLGMSLLCMGIIDACHRDLQPVMACRVPRFLIFLIAIALTLLPLTPLQGRMTSTQLLALGVIATWIIVIANVLGMLPRHNQRGGGGSVRLADDEREE